MSYLATLRDERATALAKAQKISDAAAKANRDFTDSEREEVNNLIDRGEALREQITKAERITATSEEVKALLGGAAPAPKRKARDRFAESVTDALFGQKANVQTERRLDLSARDRQNFDSSGNNYDRSKATVLTQPASGRVQVPMARREDGGQIVMIPELTGTILAEVGELEFSGGDTYRFRRQTSRDEDAAEWVPKGEKKPEMPFEFETIEDRVRTIAVTSAPVALQDLQDVPMLRDDLGGELARRVIWGIDNAIVNGNQTTDRESPNGILNTPGVPTVDYLASPFRTIRRSLGQLETAGFVPDDLIVAMHPDAWEDMETALDTTGRPLYSNLYDSVQAPVLFGRRVVTSPRVPQDTAIVGAFKWSALTIRSHIELSWTDGGELFEHNQLRFRGEARVGFNVIQPGAFRIASLTNGE